MIIYPSKGTGNCDSLNIVAKILIWRRVTLSVKEYLAAKGHMFGPPPGTLGCSLPLTVMAAYKTPGKWDEVVSWPTSVVLQGESNEVARVHRRETPGDQCICERHGGGSHLVALGKATSESSFTHSAISYGAGPLCQARWCWEDNREVGLMQPSPHRALSSREGLGPSGQHSRQACLARLESICLCLIPLCSCRLPKVKTPFCLKCSPNS